MKLIVNYPTNDESIKLLSDKVCDFRANLIIEKVKQVEKEEDFQKRLIKLIVLELQKSA